MNIQLNGKEILLANDIHSIDHLLHHYLLEKRIVIVEVNKEIVAKEHYKTHTIMDGDRIEIIHFVGGG